MAKQPSDNPKRPRLGKRPPRYGFMLNPFPVVRLSKCPRCDKLTFPRKFPLVIGVEGWEPYVQAKTCKYCSRCELIMCQQDELEEELTRTFSRLAPDVIGRDYLVLGTVTTQVWKRGMQGQAPGLADALEDVADFKKYFDLQYDPGGYRLPDAPPYYLEPTPPRTLWRAAGRAMGSDG